jgi:DNA repair protein RadC
MQSLWDVPNTEEPGKSRTENSITETSAHSLPEPLLISQAMQGPLWELTIGKPVEENRTNKEQHQQRRVRESIAQDGLQRLSDADLIALLVDPESSNNGIVKRIHALVAGHNLVELLQADIGEMQQVVGAMEAVQLKALFEVARRLTLPVPERYAIRSPKDAADLVMPFMAYLDHEELRVLLLDTKNHVVANQLLYQGTLNSSVLRASEIFRLAVTRNSNGIIVCHNHPSGDPTPSAEDIEVTQQLVEAAKHLDIELLDHLVIGDHRYVSLKERIRWA